MSNKAGVSKNELDFEPLQSTLGADYEAAMAIYMNSFPLHEQQTTAIIRERVSTGSNQLIVGKLGEEIVFMALLWPLNNSPFILLDYMATDKKHRGKKIGAQFLQHMKLLLETSNTYFILEAENPAFGHNREQREQRIRFYRSNGAKQLMDVQFTLPALQEGLSTEMILMIFPGWPADSIDSIMVGNIIKRIYRELYNRNEEEALANSSGYIGKATINLS